jgi:hypothetical protein
MTRKQQQPNEQEELRDLDLRDEQADAVKGGRVDHQDLSFVHKSAKGYSMSSGGDRPTESL